MRIHPKSAQLEIYNANLSCFFDDYFNSTGDSYNNAESVFGISRKTIKRIRENDYSHTIRLHLACEIADLFGLCLVEFLEYDSERDFEKVFVDNKVFEENLNG